MIGHETVIELPNWLLNGMGFAALLAIVIVLRGVMVRRRRQQYDRIRRTFQTPAAPPPLPVAARCPRCAAMVTPGAAFCGRCGQPMPLAPAPGASRSGPLVPGRPPIIGFYILVVLLGLVGLGALLFLTHRDRTAPPAFPAPIHSPTPPSRW